MPLYTVHLLTSQVCWPNIEADNGQAAIDACAGTNEAGYYLEILGPEEVVRFAAIETSRTCSYCEQEIAGTAYECNCCEALLCSDCYAQVGLCLECEESQARRQTQEGASS